MRNSLYSIQGKAFLSVLLILLLIAVVHAVAERPEVVWEKTYGGPDTEMPYEIAPTDDGGFIIVGKTGGTLAPKRFDVYLLKIDRDGNKLWNTSFGGKYYENGKDVIQTRDGGYIIVGDSDSFDPRDKSLLSQIYLVKTNPAGQEEWFRTFGDMHFDYGNAVQETMDGGFIIAGSLGLGASQYDIIVIKTNSTGELEWQSVIGGWHLDHGLSVIEAGDGYFVLGSTLSFGEGMADVFLLKLDMGGNLLWNTTYGGRESDYGVDMVEVGDGFVIAGYSDNPELFHRYDVMLLKTDKEGNLLWQRYYGGFDSEVGMDIEKAPEGFIIAGYKSDKDWNNVFVLRTDESGAEQWNATYGIPETDEQAHGVAVADDGFYIAAYQRGDVYVIKLAPDTVREEFVRGDANNDGVLDLGDAISLLNFLFVQGHEIICPDAADVNDDGQLTIADPIYLLNFLFNQKAQPPQPFPDPGLDPTDDGLDCSNYS